MFSIRTFLKEWFYYTRRKVRSSGSQLNDVKLFNDQIDDQVKSKWETGTCSSYQLHGLWALFLYRIRCGGQRFLHLDCDIVVTRLDHLCFEIDPGGLLCSNDSRDIWSKALKQTTE